MESKILETDKNLDQVSKDLNIIELGNANNLITAILKKIRSKNTDNKDETLTNVKNNYVSTVDLNRSFLLMYQPTEKPDYVSYKEIFRTTINGKQFALLLTGKLGTNHKILLDVIIYSAFLKKIDTVSNNHLIFKTELYSASKAFGRRGRDYYAKLLGDLKVASFFLAELSEDGKRYTKIASIGPIIDGFKFAESKDIKTTNFSNVKYEIVIGLSAFMTFLYRSQILSYYNPFTIAEFKYGVNRLIINFLKSHNQQSKIEYGFDTLLEKIGIDFNKEDKRNIRKYRLRIRQEKDLYLKNGFFVNTERNIITNNLPKDPPEALDLAPAKEAKAKTNENFELLQ